VLGFAFRTQGVKPSRVAIVENAESAALRQSLSAAEGVELVLVATTDEAETKLRKAAVDAIVAPPAVNDGAPAAAPAPSISFDPTRAEGITARLRIQQALAPPPAPGDPAAPALQPVTETGSRYIDFLFPGLLGMNLMGTGLWGVGFAIADMRRRALLKRMLVTPMNRMSLLLGYILSRLVFLALELTALLVFSRFILGVPFEGSVIAFLLVAGVGAFTFAAIGILVASRARTIEAVSGLMNLVMMPMWLASGVFFSYERFPDFLHPVLRLLPLTAANDALRGIMLDGETLLAQGPELLVMIFWSAATFIVALKIFRWE